jgi:hypothetical protein
VERPALKVELWIDPEPVESVAVGLRTAKHQVRHIVSIPIGSADEDIWAALDIGLAKLGSIGKPARESRAEPVKAEPVKRSGEAVPIAVKGRRSKS